MFGVIVLLYDPVGPLGFTFDSEFMVNSVAGRSPGPHGWKISPNHHASITVLNTWQEVFVPRRWIWFSPISPNFTMHRSLWSHQSRGNWSRGFVVFLDANLQIIYKTTFGCSVVHTGSSQWVSLHVGFGRCYKDLSFLMQLWRDLCLYLRSNQVSFTC